MALTSNSLGRHPIRSWTPPRLARSRPPFSDAPDRPERATGTARQAAPPSLNNPAKSKRGRAVAVSSDRAVRSPTLRSGASPRPERRTGPPPGLNNPAKFKPRRAVGVSPDRAVRSPALRAGASARPERRFGPPPGLNNPAKFKRVGRLACRPIAPSALRRSGPARAPDRNGASGRRRV